MSDRDLVAKLKNLKSIRPDRAWLDYQSGVLRSQIYNGVEETADFGFWAKFDLLATRLTTPYATVAVITLFFLGSAGASSLISKHAKPGEPLYIAKQLSEKAQFALAFNDFSKTKLNMEFARERVNELAQIMQESSPSSDDAKVASLQNDFHKEIDAAQARLAIISPESATKNAPPATAKLAVANISHKSDNKIGNKATTTIPTPANLDYFTATTEKGGESLDISNQASNINTPNEALQKAGELFDKQDYEGAKDVLDKANRLLDVTQP